MNLLEDVNVSHEQAALIARALYTLSRVDGHEEREGMLIKSFWMDAVGEGSVLDLKAFEHMPDVTSDEIAAGLKTPELRNMFIKTAVLMSYADGTVSDKERTWLNDTAKKLGIAQKDLDRTDELVRTYLLSQLSHIQNTDALIEVTKKLGSTNMADKKWGKTVLGWFVVDENAPAEPAAEDVDALIKKYGDAPPPAAPTVELKGELPRAAGGALEFPKIFTAAGIGDEEQGRVQKALDLLKSLPAETPLPVKKQIVEASLKAFGYPIPALIEASVSEIEALEAFIQHEAQSTQKTVTDASARIEKLNQEIADLRTVMEQKMGEQSAATKLCNEQKLVVQQVLEFFGMDAVAQVVKDSPKLHEPSKP